MEPEGHRSGKREKGGLKFAMTLGSGDRRYREDRSRESDCSTSEPRGVR